jgi:8-oxo-dGTP diphosphatase
MSESLILVSLRAIVKKGNEILLVQRALDDSWEPGTWEFPGGKVDPGEDLNDALKREVKEETGLDVRVEEPLFFWDEKINKEKYAHLRHVVLFFECSVPINAKFKISNEHNDYTWLNLREIKTKENLSSTTEKAIKKL